MIAWNRAIEKMTGVAKGEVLGRGEYAYAVPLYGNPRPVLIDMVEQSISELQKLYVAAGMADGITYIEQYLPSVYGGRGAYVWATASLLRDREGNPAGAIESIRDITDRKEAEEALKAANRELNAFVHTASHDLRTPLTPILGYAQLLREMYRESLDDRALDMLGEIEKSGQRMENLLEDLLALAMVGNLEVPAEPVDVNTVVVDVLRSLSERIRQSGLTVKTDRLSPLRIPATLLTQIFDNLIGNALRYAGSEGGSIEIGEECRRDRVRYYVRDHGPGIPVEERNFIFDLFYRGSTGKLVQGTGIGLATVQKIAHQYGGQAWAEETPGGGATFWIELKGAGQLEQPTPHVVGA